jgi:hypothetical protein
MVAHQPVAAALAPTGSRNLKQTHGWVSRFNGSYAVIHTAVNAIKAVNDSSKGMIEIELSGPTNRMNYCELLKSIDAKIRLDEKMSQKSIDASRKQIEKQSKSRSSKSKKKTKK